jgi:hypothetical protein
VLSRSVILGVATSAAAFAQRGEPDVAIKAFHPETRTLSGGDTAASELVVENRSDGPVTVWIGYSLQDPDGAWIDVPAREASISARGTNSARLAWPVPFQSRVTVGEYRVIMAVWAGEPGAPGSTRLATADRRNAFTVVNRVSADPASPWRAANHALGRGRMRPEEVFPDADGFRLRILANRCDGAEARTANRYGFGEYSARVRTPHAPGSLSAFFLYADSPGGNDEIDIEIHNDGTRRAILTSWLAGKQARSTEIVLPFDPGAAAHSYTIRWLSDALTFLADERELAVWRSRYPKAPMRVMANIWWPTWLTCTPLESDRELIIESLTLAPAVPKP